MYKTTWFDPNFINKLLHVCLCVCVCVYTHYIYMKAHTHIDLFYILYILHNEKLPFFNQVSSLKILSGSPGIRSYNCIHIPPPTLASSVPGATFSVFFPTTTIVGSSKEGQHFIISRFTVFHFFGFCFLFWGVCWFGF